MSEIERLNRYAEALAERHIALRGPSFKDLARAVLAVADAEQAELRAEVAAFHAECDKVGIPHDAAGLVRHHRGNAGLAAANWQSVAELQRDKAEAEVERLRAEIRDRESERADLRDRVQKAEAQVARVEALHPRGLTWYEPGEGMVTTDDDRIDDGCQSCGVPWPCSTIAALEDPS